MLTKFDINCNSFSDKANTWVQLEFEPDLEGLEDIPTILKYMNTELNGTFMSGYRFEFQDARGVSYFIFPYEIYSYTELKPNQAERCLARIETGLYQPDQGAVGFTFEDGSQLNFQPAKGWTVTAQSLGK